MRGERGGVLVGVLWVVLVVSILAFSLATSVRIEAASSQQAFDSEKAFFMAKGAAEIVYNSFAKQIPIPDDSPVKEVKGEYVFPFESGEAHVRFDSDAGRIDVNAATEEELAAVFDSVGVDRETRNHLVDSMLDWIDADDIPHLYGAEVGDYGAAGGPLRLPRNGPFESVDELLLVKNITPQMLEGSVVVNPVTQAYRRIPGLRELVTTRNGTSRVNINRATIEVLKALPRVTEAIAQKIVEERETKKFESEEDLLKRVFELRNSKALEYFAFDEGKPTQLISRATVQPSGTSRTVRLLLKREEKLQILSYAPFLYKRVEEVKIDRWRFE